MKKISTALALIVFVAVGAVSPANAADSLGSITSYSVPSGIYPYEIIQGTDGKIWFTQEGFSPPLPMVWSFDSTKTPGNQFVNYSLPSAGNATWIINGPDGRPWLSNTNGGKISKVTTSGTVIDVIQLSYNLHTYSPYGLTLGPDGRVWVIADYNGDVRVFRINANGTLYNSYSVPGYGAVEMATDLKNQTVWYASRGDSTTRTIVGRFTMDGTSEYESSPTGFAQNAFSLTIDSDNKLWVVGNGDKIVSVDEDTIMDNDLTFGTPATVSGASGYNFFHIDTGPDGKLWSTLFNGNKLLQIDPLDITNTYASSSLGSGASPLGITLGADGNMWFTQYGNNKIGKIGTGVNLALIDEDDDGLTLDKETQQGTSDKLTDSDNDGLSDLIESEWYADRDDVFCDPSTPAVCAYPHPMQKDVYVEVDWMLDGSYSMKPSSTQLNSVIAAFANKGINLVFDTGQYGGGNVVTHHSPIWFGSKTGEYDLYDYRDGGDGISSNFSSDRNGIWHYMLSVDHYNQMDGSTVDDTSSGISAVGGGEFLVAYKRIDDILLPFLQPLDAGVSGSIIHELGHNLCLTSGSYAKDSNCFFAGIDNEDFDQPAYLYDDYESSMNYKYQFSMVDYSQGQNGNINDNDDWSIIRPQDFNDEYESFSSFGVRSTSRGELNKQRKQIIGASKFVPNKKMRCNDKTKKISICVNRKGKNE